MPTFTKSENHSVTIKSVEMSKDKGSKNTKKAPADKSSGKVKHVSDYKSEGKSGNGQSPIETPSPKDGKKKS